MSAKKAPAGRIPAVGERLQVRIEKLAIGGAGIARADGFVLFVDLAAPLDEVLVEVVSVKGRHGEARILEVLSPGPSRRAPPCVYAVSCGGCNWQQIEDEEQRRQKQSLLKETLERFLPGRELPLLPLVSSPRSLRYRNRVQPRWKDGRLGYYRRRSHDFLPVADCLITEEPLADFFAKPPQGIAAGEIRVELRLSEDGKAQWSAQGSSGESEGFSFSQVNRFQNEDLLRTVLDWTRDQSPSEVWDLYCGGGNFSFPLASRFADVPLVGVEMDPKLVAKARNASASQKNKQIRFFSSDVGSWLRRRLPPPGSTVVLDPPRAGAGTDVMRAIASSEARQIVYIACHPVSLARDLATFFAHAPAGWTLTKVQGFEMFPQTDHLESIALLRRAGPGVDSL